MVFVYRMNASQALSPLCSASPPRPKHHAPGRFIGKPEASPDDAPMLTEGEEEGEEGEGNCDLEGLRLKEFGEGNCGFEAGFGAVAGFNGLPGFKGSTGRAPAIGVGPGVGKERSKVEGKDKKELIKQGHCTVG